MLVLRLCVSKRVQDDIRDFLITFDHGLFPVPHTRNSSMVPRKYARDRKLPKFCAEIVLVPQYPILSAATARIGFYCMIYMP